MNANARNGDYLSADVIDGRTVRRRLQKRTVASHVKARPSSDGLPALIRLVSDRETLIVFLRRDGEGAGKALADLRRLLRKQNCDARPVQTLQDDYAVQITCDKHTGTLVRRHPAVRLWEYALSGSVPQPAGEDRRDPFARAPSNSAPNVKRAVAYKRASISQRAAMDSVLHYRPTKRDVTLSTVKALRHAIASFVADIGVIGADHIERERARRAELCTSCPCGNRLR